MDHSALAAELIRARRGNRTQRALSRLLGYRSNVVFAWENGHDEPNARTFFRLVQKTGDGVLPQRYPGQGACTPDLTSKQGMANYLQSLGKGWKITDLSRALGRDRSAVSRFMRGQTEINLGDLLHVVEVTTPALFEFLGLFADPVELPSARKEYQRLLSARKAAMDMPWSGAVLPMTDLREYQCLPAHLPGWFASRLGVTAEEEQRGLDHLVRSGQLERCGGRYRRPRDLPADPATDPAIARRLASFWLTRAATHALQPEGEGFSFHAFGVSHKELAAIERLQAEYFQKLQNIVEQSEGTEAVAVATMALLQLDGTKS